MFPFVEKAICGVYGVRYVASWLCAVLGSLAKGIDTMGGRGDARRR